ncbi:hypothetical protein [Nannocystis pusilla]|uniref:hypothetical protein n=1 Tax=Nannocystis pusilla TaxID=889268 RepID=UPI003B7C8F2D
MMLLQQVQKDMFRETGRKVGRAVVATICATTLAIPSVAMATEPEGPQPSTAETSEDLNPQAQKHATKAIEHFKMGRSSIRRRSSAGWPSSRRTGGRCT